MITESLPWPLYSLFHVEESAPPARKKSLSTLLRQYETPGVSPPSSRINPALKRQETQPIRIWDFWKYPAMLAYKSEYRNLGICYTTISQGAAGIVIHCGLVTTNLWPMLDEFILIYVPS
jgi:hypothetical protein